MRFHCRNCNSDFTTLNDRKEGANSFVFSHFIASRMFCPNCGAKNSETYAGGKANPNHRWLDKTIYDTEAEYYEPTIILYEECQHRIIGNPMSIEGMEVVCDGCPAGFNCLTGNVDDGTIKSKQDTMYHSRATMAERVLSTKEREELALVEKMRVYAGKYHFKYSYAINPKHKDWYATYCGTTWRLSLEDTKAIVSNAWDTHIAKVIKRSLENTGLKLGVAQALLAWEIKFKAEGKT